MTTRPITVTIQLYLMPGEGEDVENSQVYCHYVVTGPDGSAAQDAGCPPRFTLSQALERAGELARDKVHYFMDRERRERGVER